jgi:hypothetical protein
MLSQLILVLALLAMGLLPDYLSQAASQESKSLTHVMRATIKRHQQQFYSLMMDSS